MIVDQDCDSHMSKPGYYQVMVNKVGLHHLLRQLEVGASILIRGRVVDEDPLALDHEWNHRIVMAESIELLLGTLGSGRAFQIPP